jgi:hypothetical protein
MYGMGQSQSTGVDPSILQSLTDRYNAAANSLRSSGIPELVVVSIEDLGPFGGDEAINVTFNNGSVNRMSLTNFSNEVNDIEGNVSMVQNNTPTQIAALQAAGVTALAPIDVSANVIPLVAPATDDITTITPQVAGPVAVSQDIINNTVPVSVAYGADQISTGNAPGPSNVPDSTSATPPVYYAAGTAVPVDPKAYDGPITNTPGGGAIPVSPSTGLPITSAPVSQGTATGMGVMPLLLIGAIALIFLGGKK